MTDNPCNCDTCPKYSTAMHPVDKEYQLNYCDGEKISGKFVYEIKEKGCLSHPQAREYLNKDVIAELERLSKLEHEVTKEPGNTYGYNTEHMGKRDAYVRAIQIIKNGVDK